MKAFGFTHSEGDASTSFHESSSQEEIDEDGTSILAADRTAANYQKTGDVITLTSKLTKTKNNLPDKLPDNPMDLSFWIGAHLGGPVALSLIHI